MSAEIYIACDLGQVKVFQRKVDPLGRASLDLVETLENPEAHERLGELISDKAGSFHSVGGSGSSGKTEKISLEQEKRYIQWVVDSICSRVEDANAAWYLAAPQKINKRIVEKLPEGCLKRLKKNLTSDLSKMNPPEVLAHF